MKIGGYVASMQQKITATMRSDLPVKHGWKSADQFIIVKGTWFEKLMAE